MYIPKFIQQVQTAPSTVDAQVANAICNLSDLLLPTPPSSSRFLHSTRPKVSDEKTIRQELTFALCTSLSQDEAPACILHIMMWVHQAIDPIAPRSQDVQNEQDQLITNWLKVMDRINGSDNRLPNEFNIFLLQHFLAISTRIPESTEKETMQEKIRSRITTYCTSSELEATDQHNQFVAQDSTPAYLTLCQLECIKRCCADEHKAKIDGLISSVKADIASVNEDTKSCCTIS